MISPGCSMAAGKEEQSGFQSPLNTLYNQPQNSQTETNWWGGVEEVHALRKAFFTHLLLLQCNSTTISVNGQEMSKQQYFF